jgi:DNA-directed RNA polymerase-5 subunit 1
MKMVAKGILKDHLVVVADSMMSTGIKKIFNNAGYKATFRPLKVQVPLTESTLFTPMKCMRRLQRGAILIHWDVWSHHVREASMQHLALSHLLRFYNENQLKGNKEYGDGLYVVLALVKTDQEKARYTFLEDVDYLIGDDAMDDICLSPELDGTLGMPTFDYSGGTSKLLRRAVQGKWHNSECKLGTKCKCLRKHQDTTKRNFLLWVVAT